MNGINNSRSKQNVKCWIFGKTSHIKKHCRASKKKKGDVMNAITKEIHDALLLSVDSPIDFWWTQRHFSIQLYTMKLWRTMFLEIMGRCI